MSIRISCAILRMNGKYLGRMKNNLQRGVVMEISKEQLKKYSNLLEEWIPRGASIAIAHKDRYIYYSAGEQDIRLQQGQSVQPGSVADLVIQSGKRAEAVLDDTTSHPYYGIGYPIELNGEQAALIVILPPQYAVTIAPPFRYLTGKSEEEWKPIAIDKVSYIESLQKKTWFYANQQSYKINISLKELELRLPEQFLRIHRSYIVNIEFIDKIIRDFSSNLLIVLQNGTQLPVSQSYLGKVRETLGF